LLLTVKKSLPNYPIFPSQSQNPLAVGKEKQYSAEPNGMGTFFS
jgi:hypothetical protein